MLTPPRQLKHDKKNRQRCRAVHRSKRKMRDQGRAESKQRRAKFAAPSDSHSRAANQSVMPRKIPSNTIGGRVHQASDGSTAKRRSWMLSTLVSVNAASGAVKIK